MAEVITSAFKSGGCTLDLYYNDVTMKVAKIVAAGLPGGCEAPFTVNEVRKYIDGYPLHNMDGFSTFRRIAAIEILGQTVTPPVSQPLARTPLWVEKFGSPTGDMWLEFRNVSGGYIGSTVHATSELLDVSTISAIAQPQIWDWPTPYTPDGFSQYGLAICGDFAINGSDYIKVYWDATSPGYAGGEMQWYNGSSWNKSTVYDFGFVFLSNVAGPTWTDTFASSGTKTPGSDLYYVPTDEGGMENIEPMLCVQKA